MGQTIPSDVLKGLKGLGVETGEKLIEETGKIAETIITGKELLGDIKTMSDNELQKKKQQDEANKNKEINKLKSEMGQGRNVESEMDEIRKAKNQKEEEEEKQFLENLKRQREAEREEEPAYLSMESSNPNKRKKSRGSAFAKGKSGKPSQADQSATAEYFKKPD